MGPFEATARCFSKYATFSGRAARPEYWWFVVAVFVFNVLAGVVDAALFGSIGTEVTETASGETHALAFESESGPVTSLVNLLLFLPSLAVAWRRMHDTGRSGLVLLIPLAISVATIGFLLLGVGGFTLLERIGLDGAFLRQLAASLGLAGIVTAAILQLAAAVMILWWLTRPSQSGANRYGPEPAR